MSTRSAWLRRRLPLLVCALLSSSSAARADGMELALSRLSRGACERTLDDASDFALTRGDGSALLGVDRAAYAELASALSLVTVAPSYAPLSTLGSRDFALSVDTGVIGMPSGADALARGTRGHGVTTCDGRNDDVAGTLLSNHVRVEKGLPVGLSVGAHGGRIHDVGLYVAGAYGKVGLLEGFESPFVPDVSLRLVSSALAGNAPLGLFTWQLDLTASKTLRVGRVLLAPYAGASLIATRASSTRVDLTPNVDAFACSLGQDRVCNAHDVGASSADFAHDRRFPTLWLGRVRATAGAMVRAGAFALLAEGGIDVLAPSALSSALPGSTARQWQVSIAPTLVY